MRATLNIPDDLIQDVQKISKEKSKTKAIVIAMESYVRNQKMAALRSLKGKLSIEYDWQKAEEQELEVQEERERRLEK